MVGLTIGSDQSVKPAEAEAGIAFVTDWIAADPAGYLLGSHRGRRGRRARRDGMLGIELNSRASAHSKGRVEMLRYFHELGVRHIGLVWS